MTKQSKIGEKIRDLRLLCELTQEELADRCELTKGNISQLENDLTSPSIATLIDILSALGTSLKEFFSEEEDERVIFSENDFIEKKTEEMTLNWLVPNAQKNEMEPILIEIEPGGQSQVLDPHDGEEFGYVLSGRIKLIDGEKSITVKKGETFYIKGVNTHYLVNENQAIAKVLWITTPPLF